MKKKSHANAVDKKGFSVVLPKVMIEELNQMADDQSRTRNAQINFIIKNAISRWKAERNPSALREIEGSAPPPPKWQSADIQAGASTRTGKRISPETEEKTA